MSRTAKIRDIEGQAGASQVSGGLEDLARMLCSPLSRMEMLSASRMIVPRHADKWMCIAARSAPWTDISYPLSGMKFDKACVDSGDRCDPAMGSLPARNTQLPRSVDLGAGYSQLTRAVFYVAVTYFKVVMRVAGTVQLFFGLKNRLGSLGWLD